MRTLLALLLLLSAQPGFGVYITDKLLAGFYAQPDNKTQPLRALTSGTPLEVLEQRSAFTKVRLGDNSEGWVENRFITADTPSKVRLLALQAKFSDLQRNRENEPAAPPPSGQPSPPSHPELEALQRENAHLKVRMQEARKLLGGKEPETAVERATETRLPLWLLPSMLLVALAGFIAGIAFKNYRIARRARRASKMKF